jgi:hypothetical protein
VEADVTHCVSAATIKFGRLHGCHRPIPAAGTKIRALYDHLVANAGRWVEAKDGKWGKVRSVGQRIEYLRSSYGLDIRCRKSGLGRGKGMIGNWLLAGEWDNTEYLDYVVDPSLAKRERSS